MEEANDHIFDKYFLLEYFDKSIDNKSIQNVELSQTTFICLKDF